METLLRREHDPGCTLNRAMKVALEPGAREHAGDEGSGNEVHRSRPFGNTGREELQNATVEACVLERSGRARFATVRLRRGIEELNAA
jgi:hypothetical protein